MATTPLNGKLWRYDAATGQELVTRTISGGYVSKGAYAVDVLYVDDARGRIFAGPHILEAETLESIGEMDGVSRIVFASKDHLFGQDGSQTTERFAVLDPESGTVLSSYTLFETRVRSGVAVDEKNMVLYTAELERARVGVYLFPEG